MTYTARFTPQAWVNNYAVEVDAEGPREWDVTALIGSDADPKLQEDTFDSDALRDAANAPQWIKDWSGPFYISVEAA